MNHNDLYIIFNERLQYLHYLDADKVQWQDDIKQAWPERFIKDHFNLTLSTETFYGVLDGPIKHHYNLNQVLEWLVVPAKIIIIDGNKVQPDFSYYIKLGDFLDQ